MRGRETTIRNDAYKKIYFSAFGTNLFNPLFKDQYVAKSISIAKPTSREYIIIILKHSISLLITKMMVLRMPYISNVIDVGTKKFRN